MVFEQRGSESQRKAWSVSGAVAALWLVFGLVIYFAISPDHKDPMKDTDMSNLTKKPSAAKVEPKADAPKADAPKADAPAEKQP